MAILQQVAFVGYINEPDLHDGHVLKVERDGRTVRVLAQTYAEQRVSIVFSGVEEMHAVSPDGMELYAIAEMQAPVPLRRFVFVNWDEEEDPRRLEVAALDFEWRTL